ncbi:MAG: AsnC family transcriptional regulator [Candidatus Micrarchaeia archaeon]
MATRLPLAVEKALEELRKKYKHSIVLNSINGRYYVYEATTKSINGSNKSFNLYLGRIKENGEFVEANHRKKETMVGTLDESIKLKSSESPIERIIHPDEKDIEILEELSNDGRKPIAEIADKIGMSATSVKYRLERLERTYGIRYTIDIAPRPFGFFRFVALVKFIGDKPGIEGIRKALERVPTIQFAATLKGSYDLFLYMFAENTQALENKLYEIRSDPAFSRSKAKWNISYITYSYGYIPVREEFIKSLKEHVWRRTKETPRKGPGMMTYREYMILSELNKNGREDFASMDRKFGLDPGASQYTYRALIEKGIMKRVTICMDKVPLHYNALLVCSQTDIQGFNTHRREFLAYEIEKTNNPTNKFALVGDIGSPYGILFVSPIYDAGIDHLEKEVSNMLHGAEIESSIISDIIIGSLGYRKIAIENTIQYNIIKELDSENQKQS